jgi:hypothetical protein
MHAQELIATLSARGVQLMPDGDGLVVKPASKLTDAEREAIRTHKPELIRLLQPCEHVASDPELADWYAENPHLTCARCFLAGAAFRSWLQ